MPLKVRDRIAELPKAQSETYGTRPVSAIDTIVIHHSATQPTRDNAMTFARNHVESRGWPGIAYHYVINPDGSVDKCQPITAISYHAKSANRTGIGICLAGSFDWRLPNPTQMDAAIRLCRDIRRALPSVKNVIGHSEVPDTDKSCPGKRFPLASFKEAVFSGRP